MSLEKLEEQVEVEESASVSLTMQQWQDLLSLSDRGCAAVVSGLAQQVGQASEIAKVSSIAAEVQSLVAQQLNKK